MYRVDDSTYKVSVPLSSIDAVVSGPTSPAPPRQAGVATVTQALAWLEGHQLGGEASVMLDIAAFAPPLSNGDTTSKGKSTAATARPVVRKVGV
jgi:hypothetical protein